jgi:predicted Zn-dependent protease
MSSPTPNAAGAGTDGRRWWWRGGLTAAVLALGAVAWLGWTRLEVRRAGEEAVQLARQRRFADAESKLRAALAGDPDNLEVLKTLAFGLLASERLAEAEPVLTRWCELQPTEPEPYRLRMYLRHRSTTQGKTEAEQQRLQEQALSDGLCTLELDPDDESAAQEVIWLCLALGRFEEAERVCRRCRDRRPDDLWLLYLQARVCHERGANAEAQALLDALLRGQPQFTRGLLLRAVLHYEADEADLAVPLLREVLARDPARQQEARYHLSLALARTGQMDEARQVMAEVQRVNLERMVAQAGHADNPAVQIRQAELLLATGQTEQALALLQGILREDPASAAAHALLASHYEKQGDVRKAAEHRRRGKPLTR